jgi:hypothetical protein
VQRAKEVVRGMAASIGARFLPSVEVPDVAKILDRVKVAAERAKERTKDAVAGTFAEGKQAVVGAASHAANSAKQVVAEGTALVESIPGALAAAGAHMKNAVEQERKRFIAQAQSDDLVRLKFLDDFSEGRMHAAASSLLIMAQDASRDPRLLPEVLHFASLMTKNKPGREALHDLISEIKADPATQATLSPGILATFQNLDAVLQKEFALPTRTELTLAQGVADTVQSQPVALAPLDTEPEKTAQQQPVAPEMAM